MRDNDGIFVGVHICRHWQGVTRYGERECCGGKKYKIAYCNCDIRGEVWAEKFCHAGCPDRNEDLSKNLQK